MSLFAELQRRNVFRVGAAYLALGWIVVQITATLTPAFHLPESALPLVTWAGVIGFPFVLLFSWIYELTPEGLKRESEIDRSESITHHTAKRLDTIVIVMLGIAMLMFAVDRFVLREPPAVGAGHARDTEPTAGIESAEDSREHGPVPQHGSSAVAPDANSIAVLPFVNMSSDKEQEYFSDGISEELLNLLAKIPQLRVIARTSSFAFKGKEADIEEIARKLHVAHVLEGSVRKAGSKVRITAQLIRTADSTHLWSETYDRAIDDVFAVQDEIAHAVVEQLKIALLGAAPAAKPVDPRIYSLILQAQVLSDRSSADSMAGALELSQQALAIVPDEPRAWAAMGRVYLNQSSFGLRPAREGSRLAREALSKALELDPGDARSQARLGAVTSILDNDLAGAAPYYQRALAQAPGDVGVVTNVATYLQNLGRVDQAIPLKEYVASHDPANASAQANLGNAYSLAGRWDQATVSYRSALKLSPGYSGVHFSIGQILLFTGEATAALAEMQAEPDESTRLIGVALAQHALGNRAESDAAVNAVIARHAQDQAAYIATVFAWRDEVDRAFEWLDKGLANDEAMGWILLEPTLASLHADPRWPALLRKLSLAPEQLAGIKFEVMLPAQGGG